MKKLTIILILLLCSMPCFAQGVVHDFYQDGYRWINTASTRVLTPSDSHFPISISLGYYGNEIHQQYYLRLYGRYELTKGTKLMIILYDGQEILLDAYASNIYHDRLGLIKKKTIYDASYLITNEQLNQILNSTIASIKIKTGDDWHCKKIKHNEIGKWINLNYIGISNTLNQK